MTVATKDDIKIKNHNTHFAIDNQMTMANDKIQKSY